MIILMMMEIKIRKILVENRRFENILTIVLQIVRPVDGLTCCVSTLNFAAVHRSVLGTKRYLLSMQVVKSNMIIKKMEMMKMMDMNDAHRLRPPSPPLDVLSHFVASRRTVEHGRLQPKQTYSLYLEFLSYSILTMCWQNGPCIRLQPKQTYWQGKTDSCKKV